MQITVKNYRGIEEAELALSPIALVAGPNGAGKTSIAQAVAAAMTGRAVAIEGVNKGDAGLLLRDGAKRGRCTVAGPNGAATANWPGASTSVEGTPPRASDIACGLVSIAEMKAKDAVLAIIATMRAEPSEQRLYEALADTGIPAATIATVWEVIQGQGWDAAHKRAVEAGTKRKGVWEHITGERYGAAKAASWRAPGTPDSTAGLDELLAEQRGALEAAIASQAVGEAEVEALRAAVADSESAAVEVGKLERELTEARAAEQAIAEKRHSLPAPQDEERSTPCPHCAKPVVVDYGGKLRAPSEGISAKENAARRDAISASADELRAANIKAGEVNSKLVLARSKAEQGRRAAARLEKIPEGGTTADQVEAARQAVAATERQIEAARRTAEAETAAARIEQGQVLIDTLAPTGLRQAALAAALEELNDDLAQLAEIAGWLAVRVGDDMAVTYGGRPYALLSASEQFRVRAVLQVSMADYDGSDAVVIDAADILDRSGRNGLFAMLRGAEIPALVCMTMNKPDDTPDLAKAGMGRTYWIGGGVAAATGHH